MDLKVYLEERFRHYPRFGYQSLLEIDQSYRERLLFWTPEFLKTNYEQIDFIITLGGDGTVLYATWLFQTSQVPPVIPFHFGSLGFLTVCNYEANPVKITEIESVLDKVVGCSKTGVRLNMRMRLSCSIYRKKQEKVRERLNIQPKIVEKSINSPGIQLKASQADSKLPSNAECPPLKIQTLEVDEDQYFTMGSFQILNDIVIDRGPSSYMSQLDLFADDQPLTTVQADGLVISTPTGSTAYSVCNVSDLVIGWGVIGPSRGPNFSTHSHMRPFTLI